MTKAKFKGILPKKSSKQLTSQTGNYFFPAAYDTNDYWTSRPLTNSAPDKLGP